MTGPNTTAPAVVVEGVSKEFRLPHERISTLKERALHPLRRTGFERLQALDSISFTVGKGEFFGIVGRNGSGKSTLLKCLAGIYGVDRGAVFVNGRVSTFIELGVGFNPDLAARDNVILNAIMLGLSPAQAKERYERVIEFAELEQFVDLKLKNYSSGMHVRLAFSVMIQVDADILLIDEVLAVGDASFQQKCFDEFARLRDEERTLLLVTHDMASVNRFCHRALLLEKGNTVMIDEPKRVSNAYLELSFDRDAGVSDLAHAAQLGTGAASIAEAWFEDERGERTEKIFQGRPCTFRAMIEFRDECEDPSFTFTLEDDQRQVMFATSTIWRRIETGSFHAGDRVVFSVSFENPFAPGRYYVTPSVAHKGTTHDFIDRQDRMISIVVVGTFNTGARVQIDHEVDVERISTTITKEAQH